MGTVGIPGNGDRYTVKYDTNASWNDSTWKFGHNISMDVQETGLDYVDLINRAENRNQ
jgi:hypothetical protein